MNIKTKLENNTLTVFLNDRIDTLNAADTEHDIFAAVNENSKCSLLIDASDLKYISSAGLRIFMKLRQQTGKPVTVCEVSPEVYNIFETTGFTELLDVRKRLREVSIEGLPFIGAGANGSVYRLDRETIIKVYNPLTNPPEKIMREKQSAMQAFIHGIPSAISFDIVRAGDRLGLIYEMIDAVTLGSSINEAPDTACDCGTKMAELLLKLHSTEFESGSLPDARINLQLWADVAEKSGFYEADTITKLRRLIDSIPPRSTFIHGDFHPGNIMVKDGEWILIDMGDASVGHPICDLIGAFQIMKLVSQNTGPGAMRYTGMPAALLSRVWNAFEKRYFGTENPAQLEKINGLLRYYSLIRSLAGVTFSEAVPPEKRPELTQRMQSYFLDAYDKYGLSLLDGSEFR